MAGFHTAARCRGTGRGVCHAGYAVAVELGVYWCQLGNADVVWGPADFTRAAIHAARDVDWRREPAEDFQRKGRVREPGGRERSTTSRVAAEGRD